MTLRTENCTEQKLWKGNKQESGVWSQWRRKGCEYDKTMLQYKTLDIKMFFLKTISKKDLRSDAELYVV